MLDGHLGSVSIDGHQLFFSFHKRHDLLQHHLPFFCVEGFEGLGVFVDQKLQFTNQQSNIVILVQ